MPLRAKKHKRWDRFIHLDQVTLFSICLQIEKKNKRISTDYWHVFPPRRARHLLWVFQNNSCRPLRHQIILTWLQERQRGCQRVCVLFAYMCVPACLGLCGHCQCHFPCDHMIRVCCRGKAFSWKCHFCEEWEMRTQTQYCLVSTQPEARSCMVQLFFFSNVEWELHSCTSVRFYCVFKKQTVIANPHTSSDVIDLFKQNILIQNECKQQFCQSNNTKQTVQNSHKDSVTRILTTLIIFCKLTWIVWCKRLKKHPTGIYWETSEQWDKYKLAKQNLFFRTVQNILQWFPHHFIKLGCVYLKTFLVPLKA